MKKPKPVSHTEITARALWIASDLMVEAGMEINQGDGPANAKQIRRFLTGKARKELLKERREKKETLTP